VIFEQEFIEFLR